RELAANLDLPVEPTVVLVPVPALPAANGPCITPSRCRSLKGDSRFKSLMSVTAGAGISLAGRGRLGMLNSAAREYRTGFGEGGFRVETLLEGRCERPYYTDLRLVFRAIGDRQLEFNWLVTDLEYGWLGVHADNEPAPFTGSGPHWLTGEQL